MQTEVNLPKFLYLHVPPPSIRDRYPANQTIMTGSFPQVRPEPESCVTPINEYTYDASTGYD